MVPPPNGGGATLLFFWECEKWRHEAVDLERVTGRGGVDKQEKQTARRRPEVGPHLHKADDLALVVDEQELAKTPVLRHRVTLEAQINADAPVKHRQHVPAVPQAAVQAPAQTGLLALARPLHSDAQQRSVDQTLLLARHRGLTLEAIIGDVPAKHRQHVLARRHVLARQQGLLPPGVGTTQRIAGTLTKLKVSVPRLELHETLDRKPLRGKVEDILPQLNRSFYARCIR